MHSKKTLLVAMLLSITIFSIILAGAIYYHLKEVESDFKNKEETLVRENIGLKDDLTDVREEIMEKAAMLTLLEEENQKLKHEYSVEFEALKEENMVLAEKIAQLEERPLIEHLRDAINTERNRKVRKFLEKVLYNIVLVRSGRNVELEPIVVATKDEEVIPEPKKIEKKTIEANMKLEREKVAEEQLSFLAGKQGKILSVDRRFNLIVINLGLNDNVREEDRCIILKDDKAIAEARIINLRYRVSAAFVDEMESGYNIRKVKKGYKVLIKK
ncbi:MAG: hypothetical protein HQ549_00010 [Candidatus Omnitrophica bacterium]|nr:hypothetical protein [Candidatus Omnitrophota bacterium]